MVNSTRNGQKIWKSDRSNIDEALEKLSAQELKKLPIRESILRSMKVQLLLFLALISLGAKIMLPDEQPLQPISPG